MVASELARKVFSFLFVRDLDRNNEITESRDMQADPNTPIEQRNYGTLTSYDSTVRENTRITLESGPRGPYWVRIRTAGVITFEDNANTELRGRVMFEKTVEKHYEENVRPGSLHVVEDFATDSIRGAKL